MNKKKVRSLLFLALALFIILKLTSNLEIGRVQDISTYSYANHEWSDLEFQFCRSLSHSAFNENVYIDAFKGTLKETNPPKSLVVNVIDTAAENYVKFLTGKYSNMDVESARRFACYFAVSGRTLGPPSGSNQTWIQGGVSNSPLLKSVDAIKYFPFLIIKNITKISKLPPKVMDWDKAKVVSDKFNPLRVHIVENLGDDLRNPSAHSSDFIHDIDPTKKRYKIAYLIMANGEKGCLMALMDALYSPEAIYLIHIDAKVPEFKNEIKEWVKISKFDNVYVMEKSFYGQWGGSSLVFMTLEGFFQLIDMAEWDYVINLSVHDYPLANTSTIHDILERTPQKSYLTVRQPGKMILERISDIAIRTKSKTNLIYDTSHPRFFTLADRFFPMVQGQWMVTTVMA